MFHVFCPFSSLFFNPYYEGQILHKIHKLLPYHSYAFGAAKPMMDKLLGRLSHHENKKLSKMTYIAECMECWNATNRETMTSLE